MSRDEVRILILSWLRSALPSMRVQLIKTYFFHSLAMAELSLCLAVLHRPGGPELELFETDESDVKHVHDFLIPLPKVDTKGVRVLVR